MRVPVLAQVFLYQFSFAFCIDSTFVAGIACPKRNVPALFNILIQAHYKLLE